MIENLADGAVKQTISILLVDDHPITREGMAAQIGRQADLIVCGEADNVADAFQKVLTLNPDLVIVDLALKSGEGLDLIKKMKVRQCKAKMLFASMYAESLFAERVLRAGASGYLNKQEMSDKLVEAIRQVIAGRMYLSREMTEQLLQRSIGGTAQPTPSTVASLADRELDVFRMLGHGMTTKKIAPDLDLGIKTVEILRKRIKEKLSLANNTELSREAVRWVLENG